MVKIKESPHLAPDGSINLEAWLQHTTQRRVKQDMALIRHALVLSQLTGEDRPSLTGVSCLQQGLTMAEILLDLELDKESVAAALVYNGVRYGDLSLDDVREHLGETVAKLVRGTIQMDAIGTLPDLSEENHAQIENARKMLLAMVEDMRVVIIKLAERTAIMRFLEALDENTAQQIAKETMDLYAPLANRLGISQLKWELEDRSFRFLNPKAYSHIAGFLHETRIDRENYVRAVIEQLKNNLTAAGLHDFEISGRAKHIYSIHRKMQRKKLHFDELFDLNAVRILVTDIEDCYKALSIVHASWQPIAKEFDDYIATPKRNGYRSIHTAVIGPQEKKVEVQIRTFSMHQESEHGVAAHWRYKEGGQQKAGYEAKITWLRQVLAWQKELVKSGASIDPQHTTFMDDRVYVFTPAGEIVEMPQGSTPLDFAYHIHSEVGHRCRGAKVNGTIVPLTYMLNTGEQVEILTTREANPSRDWLNPHLGYLKTARAKAKVHHWFKLQDYDKNISLGQNILDRELQRLGIANAVNTEKIAAKLHFKNPQDMLAALGCGDLRLAQVLGAVQLEIDQLKKEQEASVAPAVPLKTPSKTTGSGINIAGIGDLLSHTARCCKPIPGEPIMGFITKGRGVAIHRKDCANLMNLTTTQQGRLIEVDWSSAAQAYPVDIVIDALDRPGIIRDVTTVLANEKLNIIALNTVTNRTENMAHITLTVEVPDLNSLSKIFDKIKHVPNVLTARRQAMA